MRDNLGRRGGFPFALVTALLLGVLAISLIFDFVLTRPPKKTVDTVASNKDVIQVDTGEVIEATEAGTEASTEDVVDFSGTRTVTITATGDCTLGNDQSMSYYDNCFDNVFKDKGPDYFFANFKSYFEQDDLTIVNLENAVSTKGEPIPQKDWHFCSDPSYLNILTGSSVEAVSFANNHAYDFGEEAYQDSLVNIADYGLLCASEDQVSVTNVNGITVGMIAIQQAYREGDADDQKEYYDTDYLKEITAEYIKKVKDQGAQLVIVSYHWGIECDYHPSSKQETLGHYAVDQGADVVLGHHPHRVQGVERYNDAYIVYSLSNFSFGGNMGPKDMDSFVWRQTFTFEDGELVSDKDASIIPCSISSASSYNNFQPTPSEGSEYSRIIGKINDLSSGMHVKFSKEDGKVKLED